MPRGGARAAGDASRAAHRRRVLRDRGLCEVPAVFHVLRPDVAQKAVQEGLPEPDKSIAEGLLTEGITKGLLPVLPDRSYAFEIRWTECS